MEKFVIYPQDIYRDDTILRNIAFGVKDEDIDIKKIKEILKIASLKIS